MNDAMRKAQLLPASCPNPQGGRTASGHMGWAVDGRRRRGKHDRENPKGSDRSFCEAPGSM